MGDIIDMTKKFADRGLDTAENRAIQSLCDDMGCVINHHMNRGTDLTAVIGACGALMAQAFAMYDPALLNVHLRDIVFDIVSRMVDDRVQALWDSTGVPEGTSHDEKNPS
jgi:hypothetical protein